MYFAMINDPNWVNVGQSSSLKECRREALVTCESRGYDGIINIYEGEPWATMADCQLVSMTSAKPGSMLINL